MENTVYPYSDMFVRYLLGDEKNSDLLISFINAVHEDYKLPLISAISIKNPFNLKTFVEEKESAIDVKAADEKGRLYDIEVQIAGNKTFKYRSLYYWAKLYSSQISENEEYQQLKPAICINLLNFSLIQNYGKPHSCFLLKEMENPDLVLLDHLILHFLELPKFVKKSNFDSLLDKWLAYFKYEGAQEGIMETIIKDEPVLEKAHNQYTKFTSDEQLMSVYEARIKYQQQYNSDIAYAKEEGKLEGKQEDAQKMLAEGLSVELISRITGLSLQEIEKLQR